MQLPVSDTKRSMRENKIINAAEKVFSDVGFANTKMEEIAKEAGISKGSVYFYFDTKENLYMAVTYKALQMLNDHLYRTIDGYKDKSGFECVLAIVDTYLNFCEKHFFYSEAILDYMRLNRSTKAGKDKSKLTNALRDSIYYRKVQDIQNLPITLITNEIHRGVKDGSIRNKERPELLYLLAWGSVIGFVKLNVAAGAGLRKSLLNVNIHEWKEYQKQVLKSILLNEI
jgi:AcrR family transcriptional regulator